ncbi:MAG: GNAT family N-acetyltransferase [Bacteroides sp.]|nr:GNAT family N-acetyltransferase [Roseburia sp.]MCM1461770.1 GNAT family N-acetyltransferase [Bacteroides sp.]
MAREHYGELLRLLALDLNARPEDFRGNKNVLTVSALREGRRRYDEKEPPFFQMATLGTNAVVTADERLHPFLREWIAEKTGFWLFETPNLIPLERELNRFGYTLLPPHHMFLSASEVTPTRSDPVKWFFGRGEIEPFYGDPRFPNAICTAYTPARPDTVAVCAYDGDKIMGMAGCSEDAPGWEQIGIDVLPEYRSRGVGTYLVTLLKNKILRHGNIPFYGTSAANIASQNIALNCGFRPTWVDLGAKRIGERQTTSETSEILLD